MAAFNQAIKAFYDAAQVNADTSKLFADKQIKDFANPAERKRVREYAMYEVANNGYLKGMVKTRQIDLIGTGPKLQILSDDNVASQEVEEAWRNWVCDTNMAAKLRLLVSEWDVSGEGFALMVTNSRSPNPVKLDLQVLSIEQIADISDEERYQYEGITYDEYGNPIFYEVLTQHPGGDTSLIGGDSESVPAENVIHLYTQERAGQLRGVSGLVASLMPAALLRNYTLAVVKAANIAAAISFLLHTEEVGEDATACEPYDVVDLEAGTGMALPDGYKATQLKAEQPTDTFREFKTEMLNEVGRPLVMPRLKASGDASQYNYSSGRLDGQEYYHGIDVDRSHVENVVVEKLFRAWWKEAATVLSPGAKALVEAGQYPAFPRHRWGWDGRPHVDPQKESQADAIQLSHGMAGLHELYAKRGLDCEAEMEKAAKCLGVSLDEYKRLVRFKVFELEQIKIDVGETGGQKEDKSEASAD